MFTIIMLAASVLAVSNADDSFNSILKSNTETANLYREYKAVNSLYYQPEEDSGRYANFKKSAALVAQLNSDSRSSAVYTLNEFSVLSAEEKQAYLGLNISLIAENPAPAVTPDLSLLPDEKVWTDDGYVTEPEHQKECGSSWALSAASVISFQYKLVTGTLRKFSAQEFLDCVYPYGQDGCMSGSYNDAYQYVQKTDRLGWNVWYQYVYFGLTCMCDSDRKLNYMLAGQITGYQTVAGGEEANIEALSTTAVTAAFEATDAFMHYQYGVLKDTSCNSVPNHAIMLVGYTADYVVGKNSFGQYWGEHGFVKFARNHDNCHLWKYSSYPVMVATGAVDRVAVDDPTVYNHTATVPHPNCPNLTDKSYSCSFIKCGETNELCEATCNACPVKFKFPDPHPDCDKFSDISDDCDRVHCLKPTTGDMYKHGICNGTCNGCLNPKKEVAPHPDCDTLTDTRRDCDLADCFRPAFARYCQGTCNRCPEPLKLGPVHPDCDKYTDNRDDCDRMKCFGDSARYNIGQCQATCNNCPNPIKDIPPAENCANLSDFKLGCKLEDCYNERNIQNCQGTCNRCTEPIKLGPVHPECKHFTDLVDNCDRMRCFTWPEHITRGRCKATCNNCPVPVKVPEPHPSCPNITDTRASCSLYHCFKEDYKRQCMGTCNFCPNPINVGPPHPDCEYFTDTVTTCNKLHCMNSPRDYYNNGTCKATCHGCPNPVKVPKPYPGCDNFTDKQANCQLKYCYDQNYRDNQCAATCHNCPAGTVTI